MPNPIRVLVAVLCLAGCTALEPTADPNDRTAVAAGTEIAFDPHMGHHKAVAPSVLDYKLIKTVEDCGGLLCNHHSSRYMLRAWSEELPFGEIGGQLYVTARFNQDWAFLDSAWSGGRSLPVTVIDRDVVSCEGVGCTVVETIGVGLTREELKTASAQGFSVKLSGSRDSVILEVPAPYFAGFLDALESRAGP